MKLNPQILATQGEFEQLRHYLHENPELGFEEFNTAKIVAQRLREYGYEVCEGVAKTGVIGLLKKGQGPRRLGLRADMDALPILENTSLPFKSKKPGVMHACGHDGHTSSLLMAAKYLAGQDFNGTLILYFQPAEEGLGGARMMIEEGLFERFDSDFIFGWHNMPFGGSKKFYLKRGAMMASSDTYEIEVRGVSGHGSAPDKARDPIYAASLLVVALQGIASRSASPQSSPVVSVCCFHAGEAFNIIPDSASLKITARALDEPTRSLIESRIREIAAGLALAQGVEIEVIKQEVAPVTMNDDAAVDLAREVAVGIFGEEACEFEHEPLMASEDFGFFCQVRPCAYAFLENENEIFLHNSSYVFNDALLARAATYYSALALKYLV